MRVSKEHRFGEYQHRTLEGTKKNVKAIHSCAYDIKANYARNHYAYVKYFRKTQKRRWETNTNTRNNEK